MSETFEPVDFSNVHEGDIISFARRNNGFGGSGDIAWRTGTVTRVTDKTVTVECEDVWGKTGILRKANWRERCVSKAVTEQTVRRPYSAKSVRYVESAGGTVVTAVWVSDPTVDPAEALKNILRRDLPYEVEVIGEATRHYQSEGASFSGWIVAATGSGYNYSDSIPNKRQAMRELRWTVADVFTRRGTRA